MLVPWTLAASCCVVRFCGVQRCLFAQGKKTHHTFWLAPSAQTGKNSLVLYISFCLRYLGALCSTSSAAPHTVSVQRASTPPQHLAHIIKQRKASRCIECVCNATSAIVSLCILCEPEPATWEAQMAHSSLQQPAAHKDKQRPQLLSQHYHSANCISGVPIPCDWARSDSKCRAKVYSVSAKCE